MFLAAVFFDSIGASARHECSVWRPRFVAWVGHASVFMSLILGCPEFVGTAGMVSPQIQDDHESSCPHHCRNMSNPSVTCDIGPSKLTLTAGSNVLFVELGWSPWKLDQAEDRALRIGQTKQVNVYYLVGRDTVEEKVLSVLEEKSKTTGKILDGKGGAMKLLSLFLLEAL